MERDARKFKWVDLEQSMVQQWYAVCKIMSHMVPRTFPYFTFKGILDSIKEDPNYKNKKGN